MTKEKCAFCDYNLIKKDVLWESDNFFVKVGIGIFAPGHVMMISKKHASCFGELPKQLIKEFMSFKEEVFNKIKSNFFEPIIYEHGIYGQSVKHAHIHFIPFKTDFFILDDIGKKVFRDLKSTQIDNIFQMMDIFEKDGSYMYLEEKDKKQIFYTKELQKGLNFRKEIARLTGLHGLADWRNMAKEEEQRNREWIKITKDVLKKNVKF
ncbi:MAG: HIT family protein [Nanoarchaeota archaeon]|nr:HIT family protein [Nanoarchaeota archaeon]